MAAVHVRSWRETYRGVMSDDVLDDPGLLAARQRFWTRVLTDDRWSSSRVVVAEADSRIIGLAMSGPPRVPEAGIDAQLLVLYVAAEYHGRGAGAALLTSVLDPREAAVVWVVDPNPRAQAFYRKHGFVPDGRRTEEDGVAEIRLSRFPT